MRWWNWHALVALVLALGASVTIVLLAWDELHHSGHVSESEASLLSAALGAIVGAVAVYLGGVEKER